MISIREIAEKLEGMIIGNEYLEIDGISKLEWAKSSDITWSFTKKDKIQELLTEAKVVITRPFFQLEYKKTYIFTEKSMDEILDEVTKLLKEEKDELEETYIDKEAIVNEKAYINSKNVYIGSGSKVGPGVVIEENVFIGKNTKIEANVVIKEGTIIGDFVVIDSGCVIGNESFFTIKLNDNLQMIDGCRKVLIKDRVFIGANTTIGRGVYRDTIIEENTKIGTLVAIGHDTQIGTNCRIVSQAGIASQSTIGDNVTIFAQAGIADGVNIGDSATIYAKSGVKKDVENSEEVSGIPAINHKKNLKLIGKQWRTIK